MPSLLNKIKFSFLGLVFLLIPTILFSNDSNNPPGKLCLVEELDEESMIVHSYQDDWFINTPKGSKISNDIKNHFVQVQEEGITTYILVEKSKKESGVDDYAKQFSKGFIKGITKSLGCTEEMELKQSKVGENKRPAIYGDISFKVEEVNLRLLASITYAKNSNKDYITHVTTYVVDEESFKSNKDDLWNSLFENYSCAWYRYSDTDDDGNIVNNW